MPHLNYGILLWGFNCDQLEALQKKCIRLICNTYHLEHTEKLFKIHKTLKIEEIFKLKCLVFYNRFQSGSLPTYLSNLFTSVSDNERYSLRRSSNTILKEYTCKNRNSENNIRFYIPKMINSLNGNFKFVLDDPNSNPTSLKRNIKSEMINNYSSASCDNHDCYACNQKLFFPKYLPKFLNFINIYSYLEHLN